MTLLISSIPSIGGNVIDTLHKKLQTNDENIKNICLNSPPGRPDWPDGPSEGYAGYYYTYNTSANDPDGDDVYYWFDWDDGTNSGWMGPYPSGTIVSALHSWYDGEDCMLTGYIIRVKAKDIYGAESYWSPGQLFFLICPVDIVNIMDGFGITVVIKNLGLFDINANIEWSIRLNGDLILFGHLTSGTIRGLSAQSERRTHTRLLFGFGEADITVKIECGDMEMYYFLSAYIFGPFVQFIPR